MNRGSVARGPTAGPGKLSAPRRSPDAAHVYLPPNAADDSPLLGVDDGPSPSGLLPRIAPQAHRYNRGGRRSHRALVISFVG